MFKKLLRRQKAMGIEKPDDMLDFRLLSEIAVNNDGETDEEKVKSLIRLLRPNRNGDLSLLDFAKVRFHFAISRTTLLYVSPALLLHRVLT